MVENKKKWRRLTSWKSTSSGMWAWLTQRLAALVLIPLIVLHMFYPYMVLAQFLLLMAIVFHGMLGVRVLLIDMGVGLQSQKLILGIVTSIGLMLIVTLWWHAL